MDRDDTRRYEGDALLLPSRVDELEREAEAAKQRDEQYRSQQLKLNAQMVVFTALLAVVGLIGSAISIWQATIAQRSANAAKSAALTAHDTLVEMQHSGTDTHALAVAAGNQADAATVANTTTREALTSVQRAFVSFAGTTPAEKAISDDKITALIITLPWQNTGTTPTRNAESRVNWEMFPGGMPEGFTFPDQGKVESLQFEIPPRGFGNGTVTIPIGFIDAARKGNVRLFVWGWITYHDIFEKTPTRLSEFCDEITDIKSSTNNITDSSSNISWKPKLCRVHNCSDERCADYRQRTRLK